MSIWSKLSALFRGTAHDGAQTIVDANALRILDQEIRDADNAQGKARDELAKLVARRRSLETEVAQLTDQSRKYESSARAAMNKGDQALALEVAQRIADLEKDATQKSGQMTELRAAEEKMRTVISQTDVKIEALRREIEMVKVNESVQKAQAAVISRSGSASGVVGSAADSLKRIKERQSVREEQFKLHNEAEERKTGADLDAKLAAAGILPGGGGAEDVLARLMAPKDEALPAPMLAIEDKQKVSKDGSDA
ncbi:PspA/IM30 family protein [Caulobacter sp. 1776]|uniref:PspA/IM30 family protein n=1 Tax=Caulobacter sp. 1776 TaxID=3156420 RepID=UPI003398C80F